MAAEMLVMTIRKKEALTEDLSRRSSTSHHRFLVRLAGGELGGGVSAAVGVSVVWVQIVVAMSGGAQAVKVVVVVPLWRQRRR
jgi:hypothetical protein